MEGTYTSPERVVRDGRLVAFEGEVMTMQEAQERGLLDDKPKKAPTKKGPKEKTGEDAEAAAKEETGEEPKEDE